VHQQRVAAIRRVAVIGAGPAQPFDGMMLALRCSQSGFETVLEDVLPGNLRQAVARLEVPLPANLSLAGSIEHAVRNADLVIDTVPDELESKLEIWSLLDRMAPPHTLFATPTTVLSVADLASCTYRSGQCFGLRLDTPGTGDAGETWRLRIACPPSAAEAAREAIQAFFLALGADVVLEEDTAQLP
jgi:3-hydroxybutyryl-CoA dehydrogenase